MAVQRKPITKSASNPRITPGKRPLLSVELFVIPLEADRYLIYAPLRRAAFAGNAKVVNLLADLKSDIFDQCADPDGDDPGHGGRIFADK